MVWCVLELYYVKCNRKGSWSSSAPNMISPVNQLRFKSAQKSHIFCKLSENLQMQNVFGVSIFHSYGNGDFPMIKLTIEYSLLDSSIVNYNLKIWLFHNLISSRVLILIIIWSWRQFCVLVSPIAVIHCNHIFNFISFSCFNCMTDSFWLRQVMENLWAYQLV